MDINSIIQAAVRRLPAVLPYLKGDALLIALNGESIKTVEFYARALKGLVRSVYNNMMGGEFVTIHHSLIQGQLTQAFQYALDEDGADWFPELRTALASMIAAESTYVVQFFHDIIDARIDGTPIEPLLYRADIWAMRWQDAYNLAKLKIHSLFGERLQWVMGYAEHCDTCRSLNGIVAFAREWESLNVRPQNPPNPLLICQGWRCKCSLVLTKQRRSPKAFDTIMNIVGRI